MALIKKRSFFERLSGSSPTGEYDPFDEDMPIQSAKKIQPQITRTAPSLGQIQQEEDAEGQLPVDVYQTANEMVIRAFVAGVRADDLNVSISRDMVIIEGSREEREQVSESDYFTRELFWGAFTRTILLPQEADVENSAATSKDGLLTIILPKHDKARQTKIKVKIG